MATDEPVDYIVVNTAAAAIPNDNNGGCAGDRDGGDGNDNRAMAPGFWGSLIDQEPEYQEEPDEAKDETALPLTLCDDEALRHRYQARDRARAEMEDQLEKARVAAQRQAEADKVRLARLRHRDQYWAGWRRWAYERLTSALPSEWTEIHIEAGSRRWSVTERIIDLWRHQIGYPLTITAAILVAVILLWLFVVPRMMMMTSRPSAVQWSGSGTARTDAAGRVVDRPLPLFGFLAPHREIKARERDLLAAAIARDAAKRFAASTNHGPVPDPGDEPDRFVTRVRDHRRTDEWVRLVESGAVLDEPEEHVLAGFPWPNLGGGKPTYDTVRHHAHVWVMLRCRQSPSLAMFTASARQTGTIPIDVTGLLEQPGATHDLSLFEAHVALSLIASRAKYGTVDRQTHRDFLQEQGSRLAARASEFERRPLAAENSDPWDLIVERHLERTTRDRDILRLRADTMISGMPGGCVCPHDIGVPFPGAAWYEPNTAGNPDFINKTHVLFYLDVDRFLPAAAVKHQEPGWFTSFLFETTATATVPTGLAWSVDGGRDILELPSSDWTWVEGTDYQGIRRRVHVSPTSLACIMTCTYLCTTFADS